MISFVMIGFIVVIISGAMRLGIRAVDSGEKKINSLERVRTSLNIVDSQLQSQNPLTFEEDGEKRYYFEGDRESVQFSTNYSIWGARNGYVVVRYRIEDDQTGKKQLIASEQFIGTDSAREATLFTGLDTIGFEYFYKDPTEEKGEWVEEWSDKLALPEKVRLNFVSGEKAFALIIPMRAAGSLTQTTAPATSTTIPGATGTLRR